MRAFHCDRCGGEAAEFYREGDLARPTECRRCERGPLCDACYKPTEKGSRCLECHAIEKDPDEWPDPKHRWSWPDFLRLVTLVGDNLYAYHIDVVANALYVEVNDSDLFAWGYSGSIPLPPSELDALERAYTDAKAAHDRYGWIYGPHLWCARKMGHRPQGAQYPKRAPELWPLFDAAGPDYPVGPGNPYAPGTYPSSNGYSAKTVHKQLEDVKDSGPRPAGA